MSTTLIGCSSISVYRLSCYSTYVTYVTHTVIACEILIIYCLLCYVFGRLSESSVADNFCSVVDIVHPTPQMRWINFPDIMSEMDMVRMRDCSAISYLSEI